MVLVPFNIGRDVVEHALLDVRVLVWPVLVEFERHQHAHAVARGVVERQLVELRFEPALDGVDPELGIAPKSRGYRRARSPGSSAAYCGL